MVVIELDEANHYGYVETVGSRLEHHHCATCQCKGKVTPNLFRLIVIRPFQSRSGALNYNHYNSFDECQGLIYFNKNELSLNQMLPRTPSIM